MCTDVLNALDVLVEYPDLQEYIKDFDAPTGFMFTRETNPQRLACAAQLEALLDTNGNHSGGSWGSLLRSLQAVYTGAVTRAQLEEKVEAEKRRIEEWEAAYQRRQAAAAQVRAEAEEADRKFNCHVVNIIK